MLYMCEGKVLMDKSSYCDSSVVILSFSFFIPLLYSVTPWVLVILWEKC